MYLRRKDILQSERLGICPLPAVKLSVAKGVFPAKVVPIGHVVGQDKYIWVVYKFENMMVGGRARRAALALEQLDDRNRVHVGI